MLFHGTCNVSLGFQLSEFDCMYHHNLLYYYNLLYGVNSLQLMRFVLALLYLHIPYCYVLETRYGIAPYLTNSSGFSACFS